MICVLRPSYCEDQALVWRQKPIFGLKCAISGNNHFFAFFDSSWYVYEILPEWELAIGLAFSESKMAAKMGETYNICRSEHIFCSRHTTMTILVSKCMFLMMRNPMLWLLYQLGANFMVYLHSSCEIYHKLAIIIVTFVLFLFTDVYFSLFQNEMTWLDQKTRKVLLQRDLQLWK